MIAEPSSRRPRIGLEDFLLLAAVLLLPWAFAGLEIWAHRSAALLLVAGSSVALWKRGWSGWGLAGRGSLWLLPAFLLALWAALQLVPLPPGAIRVLSPAAHGIYVAALPGYPGPPPVDLLRSVEDRALERVPEADGVPLPEQPDPYLDVEVPVRPSNWRPVSLWPDATRERLAWYLALLLGFLAIRQRVSEREVYRVYRAALLVGLTALAAFALIQAHTWNGKIYWVRHPLGEVYPFGPYRNPSHFGALMEFAVPWLVSYAWTRDRRVGRDLYIGRLVLSLGAAALCFVAAVAAAGRMAVILIAASLTVLAVLGVRTRRARLAILGILIVLLAAAGGVLSRTRLGERIRDTLESSRAGEIADMRLVVWGPAVEMIRDFEITGVGFGAFVQVAPRYLPAGAYRKWSELHNDYLELVVEGGLVAGLLMLWLAWGYGSRVLLGLRGLPPRRFLNRLGPLLGVGALGIHALFDFNHQTPATGLIFVAVAAMVLPCTSNPSRDISRGSNP